MTEETGEHEDNEMTELEDNEMTEETGEHDDYEYEDMSEEASQNSEDIQIEVIHMDIEDELVTSVPTELCF